MNSIRGIMPLSDKAAWILNEFAVELKDKPFVLGTPDAFLPVRTEELGAELALAFFFVNSLLDPGRKPRTLHS